MERTRARVRRNVEARGNMTATEPQRDARHIAKNLVIVAALVGVGFFAAWLRFRPHLGNELSYTDGQTTFESLDQTVRFAMWEAPIALPPHINTGDPETRPALSPDGQFLVFCGGRPGLNRDLFVCEMMDGVPGVPQPLSLENSPSDEIAPAFSMDALYFASNRAGGAGGFDLYRSTYSAGSFGLPEPVPGGINTQEDEVDPFPIPGGSSLAFAGSRERGRGRDYDLFLARPQAQSDGTEIFEVTPIDAVNSPADEREPAFSRDGTSLLFSSDRDGGAGGFDLYRSVQTHGAFLKPEALLGVNSTLSERAPLPTEDGFSLLFAAGDDNLDLYRAQSVELFRIPGRPVGWMDLLVLLTLLLIALLAWLAKRWEALDILYKCFLIALLIHLLMLWYFQRVNVESDEVELPGREALFQVRVAVARSAPTNTRDRGGSLEASARSAESSATAPARTHLDAPAAPAPAAAPARAVSRSASPANAAPARLRTQTATPTASQSDAKAVAVRDQAAPSARIQGGAPELTLAAPGKFESTNRGASSAPNRADQVLMAAANSVDRADAQPSGLTGRLERASQTDALASAPARGASSAEPAAIAAAPHEGPALERGEAVPAPAVETGGARGESLVELAQGATQFSPERGRSERPERHPVSHGRGDRDTTPDTAGEAPDVTLARADAEGRDSSANPTGPARETSSLSPTRDARGEDAGDEVVLLDSVGPAGPVGPSAPTTTGASTLGESFALPTPTAMGASSNRRSEVAAPSRHAISAVADFAAPAAPSFRALPGVERRDLAALDPVTPSREMDHTPYRNRFGLEKEQALQTHGGSTETEAAVRDGLRYLASRQNKDGFWGTRDDYEEKYGYVCVGKSALCLLAFLGAGHYPGSGTEHADLTDRALDFLLSVQLEGGHFGWTSAYSHGIATYAIAECYAINHDERLLPALKRGVEEILKNQSRSQDSRLGGGWGYYNPDGAHEDRWSRVSVSVWQIMALESARLGGIDIPDASFADARTFLQNCWDGRMGAYRYNHDPNRLGSNYPTLPASTPAALFALSLLGDDVTTPQLRAARQFVLDRRPREYRSRGETAFVREARGNLYFWYYGSLAMFRVGGAPWQQWNESMKDALLPAQDTDGSWQPISPYSTRAMDTNTDRCYSTAMCVLSLEVYYRYFTPLLKVK